MARRPFLYTWRDHIAYLAQLTTAERAVAWRSSDYAKPDGSSVYPGSVRLAVECGLSVKDGDTRNTTVLKTFQKLVALGYAVQVKPGYRGQNAEYRLTLPPEEGGLHGPPIDGSPEQKGSLPSDPFETERVAESGLKGSLGSDPNNPLTVGRLS